MLLFIFCSSEEIDACVAAANNASNYDNAVKACDDCCRKTGYKKGVTTTKNSNTTCKCSGEAD